jgi:hypothetical protein
LTSRSPDDSVPNPSDAFGVEPTDHPSESTLAAFLDGELGTNERPQVEAHLEKCAACRRALADTVDVLGASTGAASTMEAALSTRRRRRVPMLAIGMALAASVAAVTVLRRAPSSLADVDESSAEVEARPRDAAQPTLDERISQISVIAPANGAEGLGEHPSFAWRSAKADHYSFRLLTEDGTAVWSNETADTTLTLPSHVRLERGRSYFWRVDALAAGIVASTRAQRFTVSP